MSFGDGEGFAVSSLCFGISPDPPEEDAVTANSVDLIFEPDHILVRPDPDRMDLVFAGDELLQGLVSKPQVKFRYLKGGFEIVDPDHKQAAEAKKVYDYYKDLVSEIQLVTQVDGDQAVGTGRPFGVPLGATPRQLSV